MRTYIGTPFKNFFHEIYAQFIVNSFTLPQFCDKMNHSIREA